MARRTVATEWEIVTRDSTGAFVSLEFTCPYCHIHNAEVILIGSTNTHIIDNSFETDQVCWSCQKPVIVECR